MSPDTPRRRPRRVRPGVPAAGRPIVRRTPREQVRTCWSTVPSPEGLPLRERVKVAIRLNRELIEHLEQNFAPKAHALGKLLREPKPGVTGEDAPEPVLDRAVRSKVDTVIESDRYTRELRDHLHAYCDSIDRGVAEA